MIDIVLYDNTSNAKTVNKNITQIGSARSCAVYEPCTVETPIFKIKYSADLARANYLRCDAFNRYYYITDHELQSGGIMFLHCQSDPLMSFAAGIRNINCTVTRQENNKNGQLQDTSYLYKCKTQTQNYTFPATPFITSGANLPYYVLAVVGGKG